MSEQELNKMGPLMGEIGAEGARIAEGDPDGLFIYAEVEDRSVYAAVFKDEGGVVRYFDPSRDLFHLILDAWEAEDKKKRWLVMEYDVQGRSFNVHLTYPGEVNPKEDSTDRRQAALDKRYGDKPVVYPPMPDYFQELD